MRRVTSAYVVVIGHGLSSDTGMNHRPFLYRQLKAMVWGGEVHHYLDQQDDLIRNVQNVNKKVISMNEMIARFQ